MLYLAESLRAKDIEVAYNLVYQPSDVDYPILFGWEPDHMAHAWGIPGDHPITSAPRFVDPGAGNYALRAESPAIGAGADDASLGAFPHGADLERWWTGDFPPSF